MNEISRCHLQFPAYIPGGMKVKQVMAAEHLQHSYGTIYQYLSFSISYCMFGHIVWLIPDVGAQIILNKFCQYRISLIINQQTSFCDHSYKYGKLFKIKIKSGE